MPQHTSLAGPAVPAAEPAPIDLHELLTVDEVAALLKVSKSWVYEHTRSRGIPHADRLPHLKIGKYVRFDPRSIRQFIERRSTRA